MKRLRRRILMCLTAAPLLYASPTLFAAGPQLTLYKDPNCGCCSKWAEHMQRNGFRVVSHDTKDLRTIKRRQRIPETLGSCHTAIVSGYTIEGHVPADAVRRLLKERPAGVIGLAVPGMPLGSPGMESSSPQPYEVRAFDAKGASTLFERR